MNSMTVSSFVLPIQITKGDALADTGERILSVRLDARLKRMFVLGKGE